MTTQKKPIFLSKQGKTTIQTDGSLREEIEGKLTIENGANIYSAKCPACAKICSYSETLYGDTRKVDVERVTCPHCTVIGSSFTFVYFPRRPSSSVSVVA